MLRFARSTEYLPLTLTLSLREREEQASDRCLADGRWANFGTGVIERPWTILPLLRGEGREGKPSVANPTVRSVCGRESFMVRPSLLKQTFQLSDRIGLFWIIREIGELVRVLLVIVKLDATFAIVPFRVTPAFRAHGPAP